MKSMTLLFSFFFSIHLFPFPLLPSLLSVAIRAYFPIFILLAYNSRTKCIVQKNILPIKIIVIFSFLLISLKKQVKFCSAIIPGLAIFTDKKYIAFQNKTFACVFIKIINFKCKLSLT